MYRRTGRKCDYKWSLMTGLYSQCSREDAAGDAGVNTVRTVDAR